MARATRVALDLALVSMRLICPVVNKVWMATKSAIAGTAAKPVVCNRAVSIIENGLDRLSNIIVSQLSSFRDKQYEGELKYLENEVEKVKKKLSDRDAISKEMRPLVAISWRYAKVEVAPPYTSNWLNSSACSKLENSCAASADGFIAGLQNRIQEMDREEARKEQAKIDEIKRAQDAADKAAKAQQEASKKNAQPVEKPKEKPKEEKPKAEKPKADKPKEKPKTDSKKKPKK